MPDSYRSQSSRSSSERSASSTSSQRAPQIQGVMVSLQTPSVRSSAFVTITPTKQVCRTTNYTATPVRQPGKASATCLMQPFSVLSQSWYTNASDSDEAVPQWVLDGARIAGDSPRSSIDSLESRDDLSTLDVSSTTAETGHRSIPVVCKAILASWRQANQPPKWIYEASPNLT